MGEALDAGRRSFHGRAWRDAYTRLSTAELAEPLEAEDLECLATAAYLSGEDAESADAWARAHQAWVHRGHASRAARCAFWLGFGLILRGEMAPAFGWLNRARRVLDDDHDVDCVERGFLVVPAALGQLFADDTDGALRLFSEALAVGERFAEPDLIALGRLGRGQALVLGGHHDEGVRELDEVMVAVTGGEVSPTVAGLVYCAVIEMCHLTSDLRRAREWTAALSHWCDAQPELVQYRGQCLVHRAEILQLHGDWAGATAEAEAAYQQLSRPPPHPAVGDALYRLADLLRLRGELAEAEEAYTRASEHGRDPQPGMARLRLAQGRTAVALSAIGRAVQEAGDNLSRTQMLAAHAEIALAAGDLPTARHAVDELADVASRHATPLSSAASQHARGLLLLAEGEPGEALAVLRPAWVAWRDLEVPYEAARTRAAIATACRQLGDEDGAALELRAAARTFRQLGALTELASIEQPAADAAAAPDAADPAGGPGLTARELDVLALLATGRTNRAIAGELFISEKTVARHVANIFTKLGLSSRSAATAYAYEHRLLGGGGGGSGSGGGGGGRGPLLHRMMQVLPVGVA